MRSLNPRWSEDDFHARVASLAAIQKGGRVLDLGCGAGLTVPHLLTAAGTSGEVVAANRMTKGFAAIGERYPEPVATGRLRLVELDIAAPLPFASASFDSVVCQNVIECISDREGLLAEMHRILRPGGVAVISHCDWDGVLLASDDRELTRRMVRSAGNYPDGEDTFESQMGRLLPSLVARSPFSEAATETVLFVDLSLSEDSYAMYHLEGMVRMSAEFGVSSESAKAWLNGLLARSDAGQFYFALPWTYVVARR
jgi:SAM-dependent methyltransferase